MNAADASCGPELHRKANKEGRSFAGSSTRLLMMSAARIFHEAPLCSVPSSQVAIIDPKESYRRQVTKDGLRDADPLDVARGTHQPR
jgi:hypothetical protein